MTNDLTASSDASRPDEPRNAGARGANDKVVGQDEKPTADQVALDEFVSYFVSNYPPGCVISDPAWHAPKLFRRATRLYSAALQTATELLTKQTSADRDKADAARYRWLRQDNADALYVFEDYVGDELDAAIDAAMKEQQDG